jgi:ArsR family transcriptional regulator, arsenate/arsenite/antimonite-responsive transcriptional repressor
MLDKYCYLVKLPNMNTKNSDDVRNYYHLRAGILKAMAHPSRLLIIDRLAEHEYCVCELQQIVGADMSTVSKHLSVLKNAGIVADRKEGTTVYYRLVVECVIGFMECVDQVLQANVKSRSDAVRCCRK